MQIERTDSFVIGTMTFATLTFLFRGNHGTCPSEKGFLEIQIIRSMEERSLNVIKYKCKTCAIWSLWRLQIPQDLNTREGKDCYALALLLMLSQEPGYWTTRYRRDASLVLQSATSCIFWCLHSTKPGKDTCPFLFYSLFIAYSLPIALGRFKKGCLLLPAIILIPT